MRVYNQIKKVVGLFLVFGIVCSVAACDTVNSGDENPDFTGLSNVQTVLTVNDWETNADFTSMLCRGYLGRVELSEDAQYVKSGSGCAKIIVDSNPIINATPYLYQALQLEKAGVDLTDFSNVKSIDFEMYNPNERAFQIGVQLVYGINSTGGTQWFNVEPNQWTTLNCKVSREFIPEKMKEDDEGNKLSTLNVDGINIYFERGEEDYALYMDDMRIFTTNKPYKEVYMKLEADEIASFDQDWQVEYLEYNPPLTLKPRAEKSDLTKDSKGYSLKLTAPASATPDPDRYPGISIYEEQMKLVPWELYENAKGAKLCIDAYAPEISGISCVHMSFYAYDKDEVMRKIFDSASIKLEAGRWVTAEIPVSTICNGTYVQGLTFKDVAKMTVTWQAFTGSDAVIYLDNLRIEYD